MEAWDQGYVNMEVQGHFTFKKDGTGHFQFGLVQGEMDCRQKLKNFMADHMRRKALIQRLVKAGIWEDK
jgi:hypothetical protein